jgi:hypothetical protein
MNDNPIISIPVSADLSAHSHVAVKLTSTGIALAGTQDLAIGTMIRGNSAAANVGDTVIGRSAAVKLWGGNGIHEITIGTNTTDIATGDELEAAASGRYVRKSTIAVTSGVAATGVFTLVAHGLNVGDRIRMVSFTGTTAGLTAGALYVVSTVPSADTFTLSATKGSALVTWTTNNTGAVIQNVGDASGRIVLAFDAAPGTSTDAQIRALFL